MNEVIRDIEILENAVKAIVHGIPTDRFNAIVELEQLLIEKKDKVSEFEAEYAE